MILQKLISEIAIVKPRMDNLDIIEKIMMLVDTKSFVAICLTNSVCCSVGLSIIEHSKNSQDPDKIMWYVRYLLKHIKFPFPKRDCIEVKPATWRLVKWRLKDLISAKNVDAYRLYIKSLMQRQNPISLFYPVEQLELILNDGSSYYTFARYLKRFSYYKLPSPTNFWYNKYKHFLWSAHRKGHFGAFKALLKRYSHSESQLNRISSERTLSKGEEMMVLMKQVKLRT